MDYNLWQQLILGATKPFRTGANILAQNWGSALTGKDMSQRGNQGGFLKWLAGSLDPEEQQTITQKPYLSSLKSSAGMASTLAPFASQGLRTAQLAANPLTNRIAQLASQGALEGSLGGFGLSREGKEVQDTLTGGLAGAGGELFMDYLTNPQFRNMLTDATTTINPQTGARMYKGELGNNTVDPLDTLKQEARKYKSADEFVKTQGKPLYHGTNEVFDKFDYSVSRFKGENGDNLWGFGVYTSPNIKMAKQYGNNIMELVFTPKNPLELAKYKSIKALADYLDMSEDALIMRNGIPTAIGQQASQLSSHAEKLGHDAIISGQEVVILNPSQIKTTEQLTDIWKQARGLLRK